MACKNHPDRDSVAICMTCKEELCEECRQVGPDGKSYCADHLPAEQPQAAEAPAPAQEVEMPPRGTAEPATHLRQGYGGQAGGGGNESPPLAALCYLCWVLTPLSFVVPIIVLATDYKNSRYMRYHAYNGLFWGLALLVLGVVLSVTIWVMTTMGIPYIVRMPLGTVRWLLLPVALVLSILFAVKANNREDVRIPLITDFAAKQLG